MKRLSFYFGWLQKGNPTGAVDRFPDLRNTFSTSTEGLFCTGDLTGIPLIKLAAESGHELIERLHGDDAFRRDRENNKDARVYDLIIVGAGPSGVSACLRAAELGYRHIVLEASQKFNTIKNFPKGKPIYVTPEGPMESALVFSDGTKESLLDELEADLQGKPLPLQEGETVKSIRKEAGTFEVLSDKQAYKALRVVVAIGKTGNARRLGVPGESLPKVFTRLIDPGEHKDQDILVVGGGDSAIEAAVALAQTGNRVTLSYRKPALARPREHNFRALNEQVEQGRIDPLFDSTVKEVRERDVVLQTQGGEVVLPNDAVYALIGTEIPVQFFKRAGIKMEREKNPHWWLGLVTLLSFFTMLYFGKSGRAINIFAGVSNPFARLWAYLSAAFRVGLSWDLKDHAWYGSASFVLGWLGSIVCVLSGSALLISASRDRQRYVGHTWAIIKYGYFLAVALAFFGIYVSNQLMQDADWVEAPTFWYALFYTTTIMLFGIRRMQVSPTGYVIAQTCTLIVIQTCFLFLLPFFLYDGMVTKLFPADGRLLHQLFPSGKWSCFAFVLFWPLNINEFGNSTFWTWFPFVQTFGVLLLIVQRWGKGAYCGWICSCGAMAETLGDEYRTLAPHGPQAKKLENIGQIVLWCAAAAALLYVPYKLCAKANPAACAIPLLSETAWYAYKFAIDVLFAGVLGLGVYFFMGGRIWCRYGCPLAALMHLYTRFSPYRILADKKRCISCNICTKVCHMGIDVMGYANKGIPMNDVQCVRCSACIVNCPMQVLTFGSVSRADPDNIAYKRRPPRLPGDWRSGMTKQDLEIRLQAETAKVGEHKE